MNKGTLRGVAGRAPASGAAVAISRAAGPPAPSVFTVGRPGDLGIDLAGDSDSAVIYQSAALLPPRGDTGGATNSWAYTWGKRQLTIPLPYRTPSIRHSDLMPGWGCPFSSSWTTGTLPSDMSRAGTFTGSGFASNAAGTKAYIGRSAQGNAMPFFTCEMDVATLPEASRFAYVGQLGNDSGSILGYAARVDSSGAVTLWRVDPYTSTVQIGTGTFTISAGDTVLVRRFGHFLSAARVASASRNVVSEFTVNVRETTGYDGFAWIYGSQSFGYMTDANTVSVSRLTFYG